MRDELRGIISFAPTPFTTDDTVDLDGLAVLVDALVDVGGPVAVCGAVGEYASLDPDEARAIVRVAADAIDGRVPLIVGIGHGSRLGTSLAADAGAAGAAALLVNPVSVAPPSPDGLADHCRRLADASGLGLIAFSTPGHVLSVEHLLALAEVDGVIALKDEWGELRIFAEARERIGSRWAWINGMAELQAAPYAVLGADAFTSGLVNVAPALSTAVRDAVAAGDWGTQRELAARIRPFAALRARRPGYATAIIKEAIAIGGGPGGGRVRAPISAVRPEDRADLEAVLRDLDAGPRSAR